MNCHEIIEKLKAHEADLRAQGIAHAALFGSIARGENNPASDIDIMVELDPVARVDLFAYIGMQQYVASLFKGPVDVVNLAGLKPHIRPQAIADAIYAF